MVQHSLERFIEKVRRSWGPLSSQTVADIKGQLEELARDPETASWLAGFLRGSSSKVELYRDPDYGFVLSAYTESKGQYRAPHDHGSGWVVYAVHQGTIEMGTFASIVDQKGRLQLVNREKSRMLSGDCKVFLPTDIHDTRCISESVTILRFTSVDLKKEEREGRQIRFESAEAAEVQS